MERPFLVEISYLIWDTSYSQQVIAKLPESFSDLPRAYNLPHEIKVQMIYELLIQAMIEPLQKIYNKI